MSPIRNRREAVATLLGLAGLLALLSPADASGQEAPQDSKSPSIRQPKLDDGDSVDAEPLNRLFKQRLEGTRWTGRFTVVGQRDRPLTDESYEIHRIEKMKEGDFWRIEARVRYGDQDFTMPFVVQVKWAGRTPVITVDRMTLPGMGTFDARVLLRQGKYAGTWSHDDVGGHLFGTYRKIEDDDPSGGNDP